MHIEKLPRFPLAQLPTPIEKLARLSRELGGPELLIKRDDQTGLALGGNKTRKLEFLVGDVLAQGADTLVTVGAAQSNHCRQTAAAAAKAGRGWRAGTRGNSFHGAWEGIVLDPVYAGRAFGALLDLIRKGVFKRGETVLFWHTGGPPALFAYAKELF